MTRRIIFVFLIIFLPLILGGYEDGSGEIEPISKTNDLGDITWFEYSVANCTTNTDCNPVTLVPNSAICVEGNCVCNTINGFSGSATLENKCFCARPKQVTWFNSVPICQLVRKQFRTEFSISRSASSSL